MKISNPAMTKPRLYSLPDLVTGCTYRELRNNCIWLVAKGGYVNLTTDQIVSRLENMPGHFVGGGWEPRFEEIKCEIKITEV